MPPLPLWIVANALLLIGSYLLGLTSHWVSARKVAAGD